MAYLWRALKVRIRRIRCAGYTGECSFCREVEGGEAEGRARLPGRLPCVYGNCRHEPIGLIM